MTLMQSWQKYATGKDIKVKTLISYIAHSAKYKNDRENRCSAGVSMDSKFNMKVLANEMVASIGNDKKKLAHKIKTKIMSKAKTMYFEEFQKIHMDVKPMKWEEIKEYCDANGIDSSKIQYDKSSMMC